MEIFCSLPVPKYFAETSRIPSRMMSNVTSIPERARRRPISVQSEHAQRFVVARKRALALKHFLISTPS